MGVTTGGLSGDEQQVVTITVPGTLSRDKADELAAALTAVVQAFNDAHTSGTPRITVTVS